MVKRFCARIELYEGGIFGGAQLLSQKSGTILKTARTYSSVNFKHAVRDGALSNGFNMR
jgi:hypothetical protein